MIGPNLLAERIETAKEIVGNRGNCSTNKVESGIYSIAPTLATVVQRDLDHDVALHEPVDIAAEVDEVALLMPYLCSARFTLLDIHTPLVVTCSHALGDGGNYTVNKVVALIPAIILSSSSDEQIPISGPGTGTGLDNVLRWLGAFSRIARAFSACTCESESFLKKR
jgi:hypothetical protein